ncbi:hypothetical protein [Nocardia abscessus]|uniref:hypothetical protein n=1 Tax=Nocardia abscessus TaxID=120957 RepID=UPI0024545345|nr:hypothetical protein [Nocardia abscessus]
MVIAVESGGAVSVVRGAATDAGMIEASRLANCLQSNQSAALAEIQLLPFPERYP